MLLSTVENSEGSGEGSAAAQLVRVRGGGQGAGCYSHCAVLYCTV